MNFRRRIKQSRRKIRCSECPAIACRFIDTGHIRKWFCADHHKEFSLAHAAIEKIDWRIPSRNAVPT